MLGSNDYQSVFINTLGLESGDDLAEGAVDKIKGFEKWGREGLLGVIGVACCFLAYRHGLKVPTKEGRGRRETFALDFRMVWSLALDPVKECVNVKLVIFDGSIDSDIDSGNLREVSSR